MKVKKLPSKDNPNVWYEFDIEAEPLGQGGMGTVYHGYRVTKEGWSEVAIKMIREDLTPQAFAQAVERGKREASIHLRNDNLIEMYDFLEVTEPDELGQMSTHYYVVSELLMGVSLDSVIEGITEDQRHNSVPAAVALRRKMETNPYLFAIEVVSHVLQALIALHGAGYIHRDIDPTNIMVTSDGKIKLIDLGIAKQIKGLTAKDRATTSTGVFVGKPTYAAPEQILGDVPHQGQATDIYSVGALLFNLIVGRPPFIGDHSSVTSAHLHKRFPMGLVKQRQARNVIARACAKSPDNRYPTAIEMLSEVDRLREIPYPEPSWQKWSTIAAAVLALAAVGYSIWAVLKPEKTATDPYSEVIALLSSQNTFGEGIERLDDMVSQNVPEAMSLRSNLYITTITGAGDPETLRQIRDAASQFGLTPDSIKAHELRMKLYDTLPGFPTAANVAEDYIRGIGVEPDQVKAQDFINLAAEKASTQEEEAKLAKLRRLFEEKFPNSETPQ